MEPMFDVFKVLGPGVTLKTARCVPLATAEEKVDDLAIEGFECYFLPSTAVLMPTAWRPGKVVVNHADELKNLPAKLPPTTSVALLIGFMTASAFIANKAIDRMMEKSK